MKKWLFAFIAASMTGPSIAQRTIDVLHYDFSIELNDKNDEIAGEASILFVVREKTNTPVFDLQNMNAAGKGMTILHVLAGQSTYEHLNNKIVLHGNYLKNDTAKVIIQYKGIPDDGLIISKNKFGHRTFFADNWPNRAHHWIPCVDDPSDKATVDFVVTAPAHYQVVSNGKQAEETSLPGEKKLTHWKEEVPLPTKVMVIGVADFAVNYAGSVGCTPVYSWVFPEEKSNGFYDYAEARDIVSYFSQYIAPYPYEKLANVQSKTIFGGMENAGAIFYHENSINGTRGEEMLFAHEIAHQWFGDMATERSFAHIWLSEGFATYFTHLFAEAKYGTDSLNKRMTIDRSETISFVNRTHKPVVDSLTPVMQLLNPNSYQRGGWVLHMLRRQLGDSVFQQAIRQYYNQFKGLNADTKDLQAVFENVSRKKLDTFFHQWLYSTDIPDLNISWKYDAGQRQINMTITQLQKSGPFNFPLDIGIKENTDEQSRIIVVNRLQVSKAIQVFNIPVDSKPSAIMADPIVSLLFSSVIKEEK